MVKLALETVMCKVSSLFQNNVMFSVKILWYGIKFFINYDGNHGDVNDDDNDESHNDGQ